MAHTVWEFGREVCIDHEDGTIQRRGEDEGQVLPGVPQKVWVSAGRA